MAEPVFTIPNDPSAGVNPASYAAQSDVDSGDLAILAAASMGTGVYSGCAVTAAGTPNVTVASGIIGVQGSLYPIPGITLPISTNVSSHPRIDLVVGDAAGAAYIIAGAAATIPDYPAMTFDASGNLLQAVLAAVLNPAGNTNITTAMIVPKGIPLNPSLSLPQALTRALYQ